MATILVQADDFSGAAEVGQCFSGYGLPARILLGRAAGQPAGGQAGGGADVEVVDTHSRNLPAAAAAAAARAVFSAPGAASAEVLFKKTDSLWRGNVGAEVAALTGLGLHVVVAGALPRLGRTVIDGKAYAGGIPLDRTGLWAAETAQPPARLAEVLQQPAGQMLQHLDLAAIRSGRLSARLTGLLSGDHPVTVLADGETEADLAAVVNALAGLGFAAGGRKAVLAGTGGIAGHLAHSMGVARNAPAGAAPSGADRTEAVPGAGAALPDGAARSTLAVVGSASDAARRQLRTLEDGGFTTVRLRPEEFGHPAVRGPQARRIRNLLAAGKPVAVTVSTDPMDPRESGSIVRNLANLVFGALAGAAFRPDLILTGGETAREVLDVLGIRSLEPLAAVQPGAVVSLADGGTLVGTKPGSFGDDHALAQLHHLIRSRRTSGAARFPAKTP